MTTALELAGSGDLRRVNGRFVRVDSTAQRISTRLKLLRDEWFLDRSVGVPYLQRILGKGASAAFIRALFRAEILSVEGVRSIDSLELDFTAATRVMTVTFRVNGTPPTTTTLAI